MADRVPRCAVCSGLVKPDIVFFGEALPERFFLHVVDFPAAELLLILGTSLKVCPQAACGEGGGAGSSPGPPLEGGWIRPVREQVSGPRGRQRGRGRRALEVL